MQFPPLVLLIDDDRDTRLLYSGILRQEGVVDELRLQVRRLLGRPAA
jgi:hypothetical protein